MVVITIDMTAYGSRAVSLTFYSDDMAENFGRSLLPLPSRAILHKGIALTPKIGVCIRRLQLLNHVV